MKSSYILGLILIIGFISMVLLISTGAVDEPDEPEDCQTETMDQSSEEQSGQAMNWYGIDSSMSVAQGFVPTDTKITKLDLYMGWEAYLPEDPLKISIRDDLNGSDLTYDEFPVGLLGVETGEWIEFDITNLDVTPGTTYYIVCQSDTPGFEWNLGIQVTDYNDGYAWWKQSPDTWQYLTIPDFLFRTYGC